MLYLLQCPIVIPILVLLASIYLVFAPIIDSPDILYLYASIFMFSGCFFYIPFVACKLKLKPFGKFLYVCIAVVTFSQWETILLPCRSCDQIPTEGVAHRAVRKGARGVDWSLLYVCASVQMLLIESVHWLIPQYYSRETIDIRITVITNMSMVPTRPESTCKAWKPGVQSECVMLQSLALKADFQRSTYFYFFTSVKILSIQFEINISHGDYASVYIALQWLVLNYRCSVHDAKPWPVVKHQGLIL